MTLNASGINAVTSNGPSLTLASGTYTGDGSGTIQVNLGFTPIKVKVYDMTDATTYEWVQGMAATDSIKVVTGGTMTVDTNSAVVSNGEVTSTSSAGIYPPGSSGPGDGTIIDTTVNVYGTNLAIPQLVLGSVCNVSAKAYVWVAEG